METDSSALASLDINLEGDDSYDLSSCSISDVDGPSSFPCSHSPRPKKRRRRNRLQRLFSPGNIQFLYDDTSDANGGTSSEDHSAEYPHETYRQKPPLEVPIIASRERDVIQEGSSPSTILPGNALQLHLADGRPDGVFGSTPTATSFSSSCSSNNLAAAAIDQPQVLPASLDNDQTPTVVARHSVPRVHFRSRVRITSGLHSSGRSRNRDGTNRNSTADHGIETANTSASGSPSSSISAPLRYQADENNVLGPLGKRINSLAQTRNKRNGQLRRAANVGSPASERTPFLRASEYGPVPNYTRQRRERGRMGSEGEGEDSTSGPKREEEIMLGRWPWRMFNRHASTIVRTTSVGILTLLLFSGGRTSASLHSVVVRTIGVRTTNDRACSMPLVFVQTLSIRCRLTCSFVVSTVVVPYAFCFSPARSFQFKTLHYRQNSRGGNKTRVVLHKVTWVILILVRTELQIWGSYDCFLRFQAHGDGIKRSRGFLGHDHCRG